MRAMVLAAGEGTRLHPLTYNFPKPMFSILNRPVLEYTFKLLKKYGINEVIVNVHHCADTIKDYFENGERWGIKISYSFEKELLGTAGGVKKAEDFFDDTFLVMSGDGLTDVNLKDLIDFHFRKKSAVTIGLKRVETKFEYGIVLVNKDGRIKKFIEKPSWGDVFANTVNTGIYVIEKRILKYIPRNKFYDFGHNLWPKLLKRKEKIYGYVFPDENYWCDIGNLKEYRNAQIAALTRKVKINIEAKQKERGIWVGENVKLGNVELRKPVFLGNNCVIEDGAILGPDVILGEGIFVREKAHLQNCIVWDGSLIDKQVHLQNCVIGFCAYVAENISIFEGTIMNITEIDRRK